MGPVSSKYYSNKQFYASFMLHEAVIWSLCANLDSGYTVAGVI